MPKTRRRKRRSNNFGVLKFDNQIALSTLGTGAVITITMTGLSQDFYCVSVDCLWAIRGHTAGETPLVFGFANGDLSTTEIQESLDANPASQSDIIAIERTRRPVRYAGQFSGALAEPVFHDGQMKRTKLGIMLNEGVELVGWVRNNSGANLNTGSIVEISGKIYGNWK